MKQRIFKFGISILILLWVLLCLSFYGQTDFFYIKSVKGTTHQIEILVTALELFGHDLGRYPTTNEGLNVLIYQPKGINKWKGPYLVLEDLNSYFNSNPKIRDVWGTQYIYYSPAQYEKERPYDLYSCGQDRKDDLTQGDDITSWKRVNMSYYADEESFVINDPFNKLGIILIILIPITVLILIWVNNKTN
jgi:general secretion pathway protein G